MSERVDQEKENLVNNGDQNGVDDENEALKNYKKGWKIFFYVLVSLLIVTFIVVISILFSYYANVYNASAPVPVREIDLYRYGGLWYEMARIPNSFESGCFNSTIDYQLQSNGTFKVTQACVSGGSVYSSTGTLAPNSPVTITSTQALMRPGQFTLAFGSFSSNYLVLDLDDVNYEWAMYGTRDRSVLKILSRQKTLNSVIYADLVERARSFNYRTQYLVQVVQT